MIKVDLYSIFSDLDLCAVIVGRETGVFYTNQSGGISCQHPSFEGFVLSASDFTPDIDECKLGCADICDRYPDIQLNAADAIQSAFDKMNNLKRYSFTVNFDFERVSELLEDWIPVIIDGVFNGIPMSNHKCIYTRMCNCD